jgi:hypothetical protein
LAGYVPDRKTLIPDFRRGLWRRPGLILGGACFALLDGGQGAYRFVNLIGVRLVDENPNAIVVESRVIPEVLARPEYEGMLVGHDDG